MSTVAQWNRFKSYYLFDRATQFALDISRMNFELGFLKSHEAQMQQALQAMAELERGAIANPDEKRMVGHYWLRDPQRAPTAAIREAITDTVHRIGAFADAVHRGELRSSAGERFESVLLVGIGGSALGPQFVDRALGSAADPMRLFCFDNTDPDGMERTLASIPDLSKTLVLVVSKSGGTKETRNGQIVAREALRAAGLQFNRSFVAVTGEGSELDKTAQSEGWLARFPMWDWVGGRTSEFSAVGLLPAALQGFDIERLLRGAALMDELTRRETITENPAALMALMWLHAGQGRGLKDMVVLPYKDRLELFSRYLQQLVMESLGKDLDLDGNPVQQGLAVYGNKGSTDQHAYVQQLRDGLNNFFVVFIEVLADRSPKTAAAGVAAGKDLSAILVEDGVTSGDYLSGFLQGTRSALHERERESITVTVPQLDELTVGMLIALFERAVGLYASLINVNAYHQPGVEAGKRAAAEVLNLQRQLIATLQRAGSALTIEEIADRMQASAQVEALFKIARHLVANGRLAVEQGDDPFRDRYSSKS